ncbi:MAG: response regulator transcription factor [Nonlabens sp.]
MITTRYKIVVADDHPLLLDGTVSFLNKNGHDVVGTATDGQSAYNLILKNAPDLAILDVDMPVMTGVEVASAVKKSMPSCKIILLTMHKRREIVQELGKTIQGYLVKEDTGEELNKAIETVAQGKTYLSDKLSKGIFDKTLGNGIGALTPTELKVLKTLSRKRTSKDTAAELFISPRTVEKHRSNIIKKLELGKDQNALLVWIQNHPEIVNG